MFPCAAVLVSIPLSLLRDPRLSGVLLVGIRGRVVLLVPDPPAAQQLSVLDPIVVIVGHLAGDSVLFDTTRIVLGVVGSATAGERRVAQESARTVVLGLRELTSRKERGLPLLPEPRRRHEWRWTSEETTSAPDLAWFPAPEAGCGCLAV